MRALFASAVIFSCLTQELFPFVTRKVNPFNSRISHKAPVKSGGQLQVYPVPVAVGLHVPRFRQGFTPQGLLDAVQKRRDNNEIQCEVNVTEQVKGK